MKFEITDQAQYVTKTFTIEDETGNEYRVRFAENDIYDEWEVMTDDGEEVDDELANQLIDFCETNMMYNDNQN